MIIGITGGIACGKSHVLNKVRSLGAYVVDCDEIVRELNQIGKPLYNIIRLYYGEEYLNEDGNINKKKLRDFVFSSKANMDILNDLSKDVILERLDQELRTSELHENVFIEGVRIFEKEFKEVFDQFWFVECDINTQIERLTKRDGILEHQAYEIILRQNDIKDFKKECKVVVDTDCDLPTMFNKVEELYKGIENDSKKKKQKKQKKQNKLDKHI